MVYSFYTMNLSTTNLAQKRRFVNFQLDEQTIDELDRLAASHHRSRSAEARLAVLNHIAESRIEEEKAAA